MQVTLLILLQTHVTAAAMRYVLLLAVWLVGSWAGLGAGARGERWCVLAAGACSCVAIGWARWAPQTLPAWWLIGCAALGGSCSGAFFAVRRRWWAHASHLFLWENTGFLAGWVLSMGVWLWGGEDRLLALPVLGWVGMLWLRRAAAGRR